MGLVWTESSSQAAEMLDYFTTTLEERPMKLLKVYDPSL
jgi:hypothetical protein